MFFVNETLCVYNEVGTRFFYRHVTKIVSPDSSVGIATRYGLDGPGIESGWGEICRTTPERTVRPTEPPIQVGTGSFPGGYIGRGVALITNPHLGPRLKNE